MGEKRPFLGRGACNSSAHARTRMSAVKTDGSRLKHQLYQCTPVWPRANVLFTYFYLTTTYIERTLCQALRWLNTS